jgi:hypothetical protein
MKEPGDMGSKLKRMNPHVADDLDNWWGYEDDGVHADSCAATYQEYLRINAYEGYRLSCNRAWSRWYGDSRYNGFSTVGLEYPSPNVFDDSSSNENVIREIITANWNKLKKNRPQPTVVTSGGQWTDWNTAEDIEYWIRGCFAKDKLYDKLDKAQVHSMVFGDGFVGVFDDWAIGRPVAKWVPSYEIHVDPVDACDGDPRSIYRIGSLSKEFLACRFPQFKEEIWKAAPFFEELWNIRLWSADSKHLNYLEAWHLPSSPGAKDGRHVLCLPTVTLANESWEADYFPIVKVPWNPQVFGYYSVGLIEDLIAAQRMRNKVQNSIDEHLRLLSSSFWAIKRGTNIVKAAISNLIGRAVEYTGDKPTLETPEPVSPQLFEREEKLRNQMYQSARTNAAAMGSMKPAGIESGKGLRVYADLEAEGMVAAHQAREDAVVDIAWLYARRAQYMMENSTDEREAKLEIRVKRSGKYERIEWESVDLEEVQLSVLPASSLATTLAGKLEDIEDLANQGIITDVDQKRQLVGMPDLDADNDTALAPRNIILYTLQHRIMKRGETVTPDPSWDLHTAMDQGLKHYCIAQLRDYPERVQQVLRDWIAECATRLKPPAPPPPPAPPGPPAGMPPVSPGQPGMPVPAGPIAGLPVPAGPQAGPPIPAGPMPGAPQ